MSAPATRLRAAAAATAVAARAAARRVEPCAAAVWSAMRAKGQALRNWWVIDPKDYPYETFLLEDGSPMSWRTFFERRYGAGWTWRLALRVVVVCVAWSLWRDDRPAVEDHKAVDVFEAGYVPAEFDDQDRDATVQRPELHARLLERLRPAARVGHYALVVGPMGTGKVRLRSHTPIP